MALSMSITSKIWHGNERRVFIGTNLLLPVTANSVNLLLRAPFGARSDFRIFLNFSLLFKAGFAPCHGFI
jgi:hypothetical protein